MKLFQTRNIKDKGLVFIGYTFAGSNYNFKELSPFADNVWELRESSVVKRTIVFAEN